MNGRGERAGSSGSLGPEPAFQPEVGEIRRLLVESSLDSLELASGLLENLAKELQLAVEHGIICQESDLRTMLRELSALRTLANHGSHWTAGYLQTVLGPALDGFRGHADLQTLPSRIQIQA